MARTDLWTFRIRQDRRGWRVETWDALPPYGPGWSPALTGARDIDEARAFFDSAVVIEWENEQRMTGRYSF